MEKPIQSRPETRKEQCERIKRAIAALLECSEGQYAEFQYQSGLKYLKHYMSSDQHSADMLSRSKVFWSWWRNHWTNRDEHFLCLAEKTPIRDRDIKIQLYTQYNDGKELAESIHPNSVVLNESYAEMIKQLITEEQQKV